VQRSSAGYGGGMLWGRHWFLFSARRLMLSGQARKPLRLKTAGWIWRIIQGILCNVDKVNAGMPDAGKAVSPT